VYVAVNIREFILKNNYSEHTTLMVEWAIMGKNVTQLATYFRPSHYDLRLSLDAKGESFHGHTIISGKKVGRPSKRLTFHQKGLKITSAEIVKIDTRHNNETTIEPSRIMHHNGFDEVRIHSDSLLYPGEYKVTLHFEGTITRPMNGVYPCFFEHNGRKEQLLATQFESHHAREVFPCIDEPAAKASFTLTTETIPDETIISNTPVAAQSEKDGRLVTTFEKTPIMSTYLLAFVTGKLEYNEVTTKTGVTIRTYATPDNIEYTDFALDVARNCIEFYDDYFGIPYPLEKCDLIALPDFASGAMENWGCITFREQTLLVDSDHSTLSTRQYVAMVVAHELAHQWFGNLVTMRWWTDLWLNEGFASWIEYLAINELFPSWDMWTQFAVSEQQQALKLDALTNTHPVEVPVKHPDEIRTIFDAISYSKGASIIHMLFQYLGAEDFRSGLQHYLTKHAYKNTDTIDLWKALEDSSGKPVRSFMHQWTSLSGFPLVHAEVVDGTSVSLEQTRFTTDGSVDASPVTWPIPLLSPQLEDGATLTNHRDKLTYHHPDPLKLNQTQSGFYRVLYNSSHTEVLGAYVQKGKVSARDRIGILSDLLESTKYGYTDTAEAYAFLEHFAQEDNYAVWEIISSGLGSLRLVMNDEELREAMKPFTRQLIAKQLERLGWDQKDSDSHFDRLLRPTIIGLGAGADIEWIIKKSHEVFDSAHDANDVRPDLRVASTSKEVKRGLVHPDLRGVVFGTVARHGNEKTFEKLVKLHNTSHLSEEKTTLVAAITGFEQSELIDKSLELITGPDVRLQDVPYWIAYSFMNRHAKRKTWEWTKTHWNWLEENLGSDLSFYRMPIYAARVFSDPSFIDEYKAFFEPKVTPGLERSYKQGLEILSYQTKWRARDIDSVKQFFIAKSRQSPQ